MDEPSRRPATTPHRYTPQNEAEPGFLPPDAETLAQIARAGRPIWSPYYGRGHLIGLIGTAPAIAHVAEYPGLPPGQRVRPAHTAAFFILN